MGTVRPLFPAQGNFGLHRPDGRTVHVGFLRSWRPAVDRIAAVLHRDTAIPPRPDVRTA
jgi:hypothetical protein